MIMKNAIVMLLATAVIAGCASSKTPQAKFPEPSVGLEQVVGPAELNYPYGPIQVKYNLGVQNNASFPITVLRIDVQSLNPPGGAYQLRHDFYYFKETIPANSSKVIPFWANAYAWGRTMRDTEPVTFRGIVFFDTPSGKYQKIFMAELNQFPQ